MKFLIAFFLGYLLGSFPSAYVFVKIFRKIDIRKYGSGNVGALNAYEVSGSILIGLLVLLIDILKGFLAVEISKILFGQNSIALISGLSAVLGHNFSIWISFYGGRGLATSLGVLLSVNPSLIIVWCILWLIAYLRIRNIHAGNIWATIFTPIVIFPTLNFFKSFNKIEINAQTFIAFLLSISSLIFIKHLKPLANLVKEGKLLKNKFERKDERDIE